MKWKLSSFNIVIGEMYRVYPVAQGSTCKAGVTGGVGLTPGSGGCPGEGIHSSIVAWEIPWTERPNRLQSMGLQRVGQDRSDLARTHSGQMSFKIANFIRKRCGGSGR